KPPLPFFAAAHVSAAIGRATTTRRKVATKPSERAAPALSLALVRSTRPPRPGATAVAVLGSGRAPDVLLDLHHDPVRRVEPLLVGCAPAADRLVVDRELAGAHRELLRELRRRLLVHRPEAVLAEHLLLGLRLDELDELVREILVGAPLQDGDRELDQHRLPGDDVLDALALEPGVDGLALVGDQDIPLPRQEGVGRVR